LAEHPERIRKIFKNYDQDKGIYEMEMWSGGQPTKVVVDDRLPFLMEYDEMEEEGPGLLGAGQSANGAWWLPILEKAAAKFWGTYEHLSGDLGKYA